MVKSLFLSRKYNSATISYNDKDIHQREKQSRMAAVYVLQAGHWTEEWHDYQQSLRS